MNTDKRSRDLARAFPDDPDRLDRLAATAQQDRILDIAYRTIDSPVGPPCHRVVHSHGSMGGYPGGADAKRTLLTPEAAA